MKLFKKKSEDSNPIVQLVEKITGKPISIEELTEMCIIPDLCQVNGIVVTKDLCINGFFEGKLVSTGLIITLEGSVLQAELQAKTVAINGSFSGIIEAQGLVRLLKNAVVEGRIICDTLEIEPGAIFNGIYRKDKNSPKKSFSGTFHSYMNVESA